MIKLVTLMTRKDGVSHSEFVDHWTEVRGPLVRNANCCERYVINRIDSVPDTGATLPLLDVQLDGIEELLFKDAESVSAFHGSEVAKKLDDDLKHFVGWMKRYEVEELL